MGQHMSRKTPIVHNLVSTKVHLVETRTIWQWMCCSRQRYFSTLEHEIVTYVQAHRGMHHRTMAMVEDWDGTQGDPQQIYYHRDTQTYHLTPPLNSRRAEEIPLVPQPQATEQQVRASVLDAPQPGKPMAEGKGEGEENV